MDNSRLLSVGLPTVAAMEMTLTVHVRRRRPHPVDVVVRWSGRHTAADLCARLADRLGEPVGRLSSRGRTIPPDAVVGEPPLLHGTAVTVDSGAASPGPEAAEPGVLEVVVVGGPDAGRARALSPPALLVGRGPASGLEVADEALSRVHAVFRVGEAGLVVEDEGSTNGVVVDGRVARGAAPIDASSLVQVGGTALRVRRASGPGAPVEASGDGRLVVPPGRAPVSGGDPVEVLCPPAPPERHRSRVPWVAALVPIPVGIGLAVFLGPSLLVFALLGPVMLLAGALGDRWGAGRAGRRDAAAHATAVAHAQSLLGGALSDERARLDRDHPDPHAVLAAAEHRLPCLWAGDDRVSLRLGIGEVPTRVAWLADGSRSHPAVTQTPVVLSLVDVVQLAVVGPQEATDAVLRCLVGQLCATQPPNRLSVAVASTRTDWRWTTRLPHGIRPPSSHGPPGDTGRGAGAAVRVLVVPASEVAAAGGLVASARSAGWLVVAAAPDRGALPGACGAVLTLGAGGGHVLEAGGRPAVGLVADGVGEWWAERLSRALAPLLCPSPASGSGSASMPDEVGLEEVLPAGGVRADALVTGWAAASTRGGGLAAPVAAVGVGPDGIHTVDLGRDGPHVLVGGTTGSGKSEFLRTLVTSLAVSSPPRRPEPGARRLQGGCGVRAVRAAPPRRGPRDRPRRPPRVEGAHLVAGRAASA